jgi:hypothetical protein
MEPDPEDEFISSIAPDVMKRLERTGFFDKLDDLLSPEDNSAPSKTCDGTCKLAESILSASGFDHADLGYIFGVLQSMGGCCDCEVLYNVAESSRLKSKYWRKKAAGPGEPTRHQTP